MSAVSLFSIANKVDPMDVINLFVAERRMLLWSLLGVASVEECGCDEAEAVGCCFVRV